MLEFWKELYNKQEEELNKLTVYDALHLDEKNAAISMIEYRKKLKEAGYDVDLICFASEKQANECANSLIKYGLDSRASGFEYLNSFVFDYFTPLNENAKTKQEFKDIVDKLYNQYKESLKTIQCIP
jgi:hypothetical protein